jgi:hypothetical protein
LGCVLEILTLPDKEKKSTAFPLVVHISILCCRHVDVVGYFLIDYVAMGCSGAALSGWLRLTGNVREVAGREGKAM